MEIKREKYIAQLERKIGNGKIKIVTGIRRCGKSYLLNVLFRKRLRALGVPNENIIFLSLDDDKNARYRNPMELGNFIRQKTERLRGRCFVLLDEIQKVATIHNPFLPDDADATIGFVDVLIGLGKNPKLDIFVSGSNSKMLSTDIVTEFRDRGDEIKVFPLTFAEFYDAFAGEKRFAWRDFAAYGGMPYVLQLPTHEEKAKYLTDLFQITYLQDVVERNKIHSQIDILNDLLDIVASAVGSLTNPTRLSNTFDSEKHLKVNSETLGLYLDYFVDAFILSKAKRYNIKGRSYIGSPLKYYFTDVGLRNARLNFRQQEENHIMENVLYNELIARGFSVDVGVVEYNWKNAEGGSRRSQLEVDFVVNKADKRYYIQSAFTIGDEEKRQQEVNSLQRIDDSFQKIVIVKDDILPWTDERGIFYINIQDFLLEKIDTL
jgi:uncharacterized protein